MRLLGAARPQPLRINLSSRRHDSFGYSRAALILLCLVLGGLIAGDLKYAATIRGQATDLEQAVHSARAHDERVEAQARRDGVDISDAGLKKLPAEVTFANQMIAKRAFSWTRFLGDLEEATLPGLSIQSIRLDGKNGVSMGGAALTLQNVTAFIISLEDHGAFEHAALHHHRTLDNGRVEFQLTVDYHDQAKRGKL